ncbi:MAG: hypothetical protein FWJ92_12560 [Actinomycetes bacterium]|jgi:uncharacterized protein YlxW (UPF0749 family)|nr:hypothetical protein [Acidimicrobiia bacterium]
MAQKKDGLGDNIWILVPLAALSIPIFAIIGENVILTSVVSGIIVLIAVTLAIRSLMTHRHRLKMEELEAQERIVRAEREQLSAAEKILELDNAIVDLEAAIKREKREDVQEN